jgi:hypothetical protein
MCSAKSPWPGSTGRSGRPDSTAVDQDLQDDFLGKIRLYDLPQCLQSNLGAPFRRFRATDLTLIAKEERQVKDPNRIKSNVVNPENSSEGEPGLLTNAAQAIGSVLGKVAAKAAALTSKPKKLERVVEPKEEQVRRPPRGDVKGPEVPRKQASKGMAKAKTGRLKSSARIVPSMKPRQAARGQFRQDDNVGPSSPKDVQRKTLTRARLRKVPQTALAED